MVWVVRRNVPIGVWNPIFFKAVACLMGTFFGQDKETEGCTRYDRARMLIICATPSLRKHEVSIKVGDKIIKVVVDEYHSYGGIMETPLRGRWWLKPLSLIPHLQTMVRTLQLAWGQALWAMQRP